MAPHLPLSLIFVFVAIFQIPWSTCDIMINGMPIPENEDLLRIMKEELDIFQVDITKSFMETHSRRKRAATGIVTDIEVGRDFLEFRTSSVGPFSTFIFAGNAYIIQRDGIYRIDELVGNELTYPQVVPIKISTWTLNSNESVLHGFEWMHKFFFLTTTGKFTSIYTIHDTNLNPVFRQRIQNKANAVAAQYFEYRRNLYLVIANDNDLHSPTFSIIFRWAGSYMDEIHQVQTIGATALIAFTINSKVYIAFAQSIDSIGNTQLGTIVLSMDHRERLERVQLLWSNAAMSLHYMQTEKEHFLVIGQEKEASIVYWFGGMDFIFWQQLGGCHGKDMVMDGLQLTPDEPVLLVSNGGPLQLFSRSATSTKILTSWVLSKTLDIQERGTNNLQERILQMKFLNLQHKVNIAITNKLLGAATYEIVRIYPVNIVKRELAISQTVKPGDKLSQCLQSLATSLSEAKPVLDRIEAIGPTVLRTDVDTDFEGTLVAKNVIKQDPGKSSVTNAHISPTVEQRAGNAERVQMGPAQLQSSILEANDRLNQMKLQLNDIFLKTSQTNTVSGNWKFRNPIEVNSIQSSGPAASNLKADIINDIQWNDLQNSVLKLASEGPQNLTGSWTAGILKAAEVVIELPASKLNPSNFMQTFCPNPQSISGVNQFTNPLIFAQGVSLAPAVQINEIIFDDILLRHMQLKEISGYKRTRDVEGNFIVEHVNDIKLSNWFREAARFNSSAKQVFTGPIIVSSNGALVFQNLTIEELNSKRWDEFQENVLLNGVPQEIKGPISFTALKADNLKTIAISGVRIENLLTSGATQRVASEFIVENVHIEGSLTTSGKINGASLSDVVKRSEEIVNIKGASVELVNFRVGNVLVPEGITIGGKDVSELEAMKKFHIYSTLNSTPIFVLQVNVNTIITPAIGGINVQEFSSRFWSKTADNAADAPQLILSDRLVLTENFKTKHLNDFLFPGHYISLDMKSHEPITIHTSVTFRNVVRVFESITMVDGATIEGIDMSRVQSMIVDSEFHGLVHGTKTFAEPIVATEGATFGLLDNVDLLKDVMKLVTLETQVIGGLVNFTQELRSDVFAIRNGDVEVDGLVNQMNLENVALTTAYKNMKNFLAGMLIFERNVKTNELYVVQLNGVNVKDDSNNLVFLNSAISQTIEGGLFLENANLTFHKDSLTREINGIHVQQYLSQVVRLDTINDVIIEGDKTFTDAAFNEQLLCSKFNNVDLKDLENNAFSKVKEQDVSGKWSLENAVFTENLQAKEIEELPLKNLVFINDPFDVVSPVRFTSRETGVQGPFILTGDINGIRFDDGMKEFLTVDVNNFDHVEIIGNLEWSNNELHFQRLGYLFENAVTNSGPQSITGFVTFPQGFQTLNLTSPDDNKWLGGVNLAEIEDDALNREDDEWVILGRNIFPNRLLMESLMNPVETINVNVINQQNLMEMNEAIVRESDEPGKKRVIEGQKVILGNVELNNLQIHEEISGLSITDFVTKNDKDEIEEVHFKDIHVKQDVNWQFSSNSEIDLNAILKDRVSLSDQYQDLEGAYVFENFNVTNQCRLSKINDITVKNTLHRNSINIPPISGEKQLVEGLAIEGELNTASLNSHPIQELLESTLRLDREEIIEAPLIFEGPVIMNRVTEVKTINDINLSNLSTDVSERISRFVTEAQKPEEIKDKLVMQSYVLQKVSDENPVWLEFIRLKQDWTSLGPISRVDHIRRSEVGDILITLHQDTNDGGVVVMKMSEANPGLVPQVATGTDKCLQIFHVTSPNGNVYTVTSETPSINSTCKDEKKETTKIFDEKNQIGELDMEHVIDVGSFSLDSETDCLVLVQFYNSTAQSHSSTARVLRVNSKGGLETIQYLQTHGAKKVALSQVNGDWMLAIANNRNSANEISCNSDSAIYVWSAQKSEFSLLRHVATDGAFDVQFITAETSSEFYQQNFVAFAQEGNSASGEIMIFKFEQPGANFVLSQTISSNWPVKALRSTCICRQCFLVTAVPQEGINFYENRFVEGFQKYYTVPVFGATDVNSFTVNYQHRFVIATNQGPILAEAVLSGSCLN